MCLHVYTFIGVYASYRHIRIGVDVRADLRSGTIMQPARIIGVLDSTEATNVTSSNAKRAECKLAGSFSAEDLPHATSSFLSLATTPPGFTHECLPGNATPRATVSTAPPTDDNLPDGKSAVCLPQTLWYEQSLPGFGERSFTDWYVKLVSTGLDRISTTTQIYESVDNECASFLICLESTDGFTLLPGAGSVLVPATRSWACHVCARLKAPLTRQAVVEKVKSALTHNFSLTSATHIRTWTKTIEQVGKKDPDAVFKDLNVRLLDWKNRPWARIVHDNIRSIQAADQAFDELVAKRCSVSMVVASVRHGCRKRNANGEAAEPARATASTSQPSSGGRRRGRPNKCADGHGHSVNISKTVNMEGGKCADGHGNSVDLTKTVRFEAGTSLSNADFGTEWIGEVSTRRDLQERGQENEGASQTKICLFNVDTVTPDERIDSCSDSQRADNA